MTTAALTSVFVWKDETRSRTSNFHTERSKPKREEGGWGGGEPIQRQQKNMIFFTLFVPCPVGWEYHVLILWLYVHRADLYIRLCVFKIKIWFFSAVARIWFDSSSDIYTSVDADPDPDPSFKKNSAATRSSEWRIPATKNVKSFFSNHLKYVKKESVLKIFFEFNNFSTWIRIQYPNLMRFFIRIRNPKPCNACMPKVEGSLL